MDFTVGKGFEMKGGVASVPAAELSDVEAISSFEELKAEVELLKKEISTLKNK